MSEKSNITEEDLANFEPLLTDEQIYAIERNWQNDKAIGQNRRMLLAILTRSGEQLAESCEKEPAAMWDAFECGVDYVARQHEFQQMMSAACVRLSIALCAVDWDAPDSPFTAEQYKEVIRRLPD